jgi:F0F1-type ATP synthase membrane subunit b/b'
MNLVERTSALLATVEQYRAERCAALLEPAESEARSIIKAALADARRRVTTAIDEERKRLRREVGAVEASLATERRQIAQQHAVRQLGRAWTALHEALSARWTDRAARRRWVDAHLNRAFECLDCDTQWSVAYHEAWPASERTELAELLRSRGVTAVFEPDSRLAAGFIITCGHNVLDASLGGLLADRAAIEGRLLQHLEELRS